VTKQFHVFSSADTTHECDRQTDRQTDKQKGTTYTALASCGKNEQSAKLEVKKRHGQTAKNWLLETIN